MALKILFLDIDGVLNSTRSCMAFGGFPHGLEPAHVAMLDPVALALVRNLCAVGGLSVVVSSSWRILHDWDAIGRALDLPTIGATPRLYPGCRGDEIAAWLADAPTPVELWAIVDDDSDMLVHQLPRFVQTDGEDGLSWSRFVRLCELFGVAPHDCSPRKAAAALEAAGYA